MKPKEIWKPGNMLYPLPAVLVSCGDINDKFNLITISWTGITCSDPPQCYISVRPERHSHAILKQYGEFVINLTNEKLSYATDWCGVKSGRDYDKFQEMNLTPVAGQQVKAPLIAESPVNLECKIRQVIPLGSHDMFLAEIVQVHADSQFINPDTGAFHLEQANPLTYVHGKYYSLGKFIGKFGFSVQKKKSSLTKKSINKK